MSNRIVAHAQMFQILSRVMPKCFHWNLNQSFRSSFKIGRPRLRGMHSTSWKFSTWWKLGLYFLYIFIMDWNFFTKFCSSDSSFNGNILTSLYLKSETSAHVQLCDYSFIHTTYMFHGMVLAGNSHCGYLLMNEVYR